MYHGLIAAQLDDLVSLGFIEKTERVYVTEANEPGVPIDMYKLPDTFELP